MDPYPEISKIIIWIRIQNTAFNLDLRSKYIFIYLDFDIQRRDIVKYFVAQRIGVSYLYIISTVIFIPLMLIQFRFIYYFMKHPNDFKAKDLLYLQTNLMLVACCCRIIGGIYIYYLVGSDEKKIYLIQPEKKPGIWILYLIQFPRSLALDSYLLCG